MNVKITKEETVVLKAFSMLTVIFTHANGAKVFEGVPLLWNGMFTSLLCQSGMCIFLLLSGYGLYCSFKAKGFEGWWDRRFEKIYFPAMLVQALWFFVFQLYTLVCGGQSEVGWSSLVGDIFCFNPYNYIDGNLWFLSYLLFCYILFYLCFRYLPPKLSCLVFFVSYVLLIPPSRTIWIFSYYCLSSFAVGVLWGMAAERGKASAKPSRALKAALIGFAVFTAVVYYYFALGKNWILDNVAGNITAAGVILFFSFFDCKRLRVLSFIGANSFLLYLLHDKTIIGFPYTDYGSGIRVLIFALLFLFSLLLSHGLNRGLESLRKTKKYENG